MTKEKYISLKEAAQLSGYSPDYVGQLIRRGKLPGKQVFLNVAWVTTEDALTAYIQQQSKGGAEIPQLNILSRYWGLVIARLNLDLIYKVAFGITLAFLLAFMLVLVYIFSVSIDHRIDEGYQQQLDGSI